MTLNTSTGRAFGTSNLGIEHINPLLASRVPHWSRVKVAWTNSSEKRYLKNPKHVYLPILRLADSCCMPPYTVPVYLHFFERFTMANAYSGLRVLLEKGQRHHVTRAALVCLQGLANMFRHVQTEWVKHGETPGNLSKWSKSVLGEAEHDAISFLSATAKSDKVDKTWLGDMATWQPLGLPGSLYWHRNSLSDRLRWRGRCTVTEKLLVVMASIWLSWESIWCVRILKLTS